YDEFPHSTRNVLPHGGCLALALIEIANYADSLGVRVPCGKVYLLHATDFALLGSHPRAGLQVVPYSSQNEVVVGQQGVEGIGVVDCLVAAESVGDAQLIASLNELRIFPIFYGADRFVQTRWMDLPHGAASPVRRIHDPNLLGVGKKSPYR